MNYSVHIPVLNRQDIWRDCPSRKMLCLPWSKSSLGARSPLKLYPLRSPPKSLTQVRLRPDFSTFLFSLTQNITLHFVSLAKAELACSGCASLARVAVCDWLFRKFQPIRGGVSFHVRESWGSAGRFAGRPALGRRPGRSARAG